MGFINLTDVLAAAVRYPIGRTMKTLLVEMKRTQIARSTDGELVSRFAMVAKDRGAAVRDLDTGRAIALFDQMRAIDRELRTRGRDA